MASGRKNYFRHSVNARKDPKIMGLITAHGKEAYFHFWALVEMCAEIANDAGFPEDEKFIFHKRTVCNELMVTPQRLSGHLLAIQSSLLGDLVVTGERVEIKLPKLKKYLGRYDGKNTPNSPNKRKEKERKENIYKEESPSPQEAVKPEPENVINSGLFTGEPLQTIEEVKASDKAMAVLTALNAVCFKNFRPTKANMQFINARLKEGYALEDFTKVFTFKQKQWGHDPEMCGYLRPQTLLSTKFDSYLQESETALKPKLDPLDEFFAQYGGGVHVGPIEGLPVGL